MSVKNNISGPKYLGIKDGEQKRLILEKALSIITKKIIEPTHEKYEHTMYYDRFNNPIEAFEFKEGTSTTVFLEYEQIGRKRRRSKTPTFKKATNYLVVRSLGLINECLLFNTGYNYVKHIHKFKNCEVCDYIFTDGRYNVTLSFMDLEGEVSKLNKKQPKEKKEVKETTTTTVTRTTVTDTSENRLKRKRKRRVVKNRDDSVERKLKRAKRNIDKEIQFLIEPLLRDEGTESSGKELFQFKVISFILCLDESGIFGFV